MARTLGMTHRVFPSTGNHELCPEPSGSTTNLTSSQRKAQEYLQEDKVPSTQPLRNHNAWHLLKNIRNAKRQESKAQSERTSQTAGNSGNDTHFKMSILRLESSFVLAGFTVS